MAAIPIVRPGPQAETFQGGFCHKLQVDRQRFHNQNPQIADCAVDSPQIYIEGVKSAMKINSMPYILCRNIPLNVWIAVDLQ